MPQLSYPLDEFRPFKTADGAAIEVIVYGEATIEFDDEGEWTIGGIALDAGRMVGGRWLGETRDIDSKHPLFNSICLALKRDHSESIEDKIIAALDANDIVFAPPNAEHSTLNHAQQGL
jgi:hypothetical protein